MIHPSIELSLYVIVNNTMQRNLIIYAADAVFFAFYIFRIRLPTPRRGEVVRVVHGYKVPLRDRNLFKISQPQPHLDCSRTFVYSHSLYGNR